MALREELTVKDLQVESGVSASTINYYTALGLLLVSRRRGKTRLYPAASTRQRLQQIRALLDRGYTLPVIKEQLGDRHVA